MSDYHALSIGQGPSADPSGRYAIHMDARPLPGIECVGRWQDAVFPREHFSEIFASQTLEHLSRADQRLALEKSWWWLRTGGTIELWTPDLWAQVEWAVTGKISREWLQTVLYGEQDYPENTHLWLHTQESLATLLTECGFEVVECSRVEGSLKAIGRRPVPAL